jgi:hypothetical protein
MKMRKQLRRKIPAASGSDKDGMNGMSDPNFE